MASGESYRPMTRWCHPHPYLAAGGAQPSPPSPPAAPAPVPRPARWRAQRSRHDVLLALLDDSLARGHWRVALRRFVMLLACGYEVPAHQRALCELHRERCRERELRKMEADAQAWLRCVARN